MESRPSRPRESGPLKDTDLAMGRQIDVMRCFTCFVLQFQDPPKPSGAADWASGASAAPQTTAPAITSARPGWGDQGKTGGSGWREDERDPVGKGADRCVYPHRLDACVIELEYC